MVARGTLGATIVLTTLSWSFSFVSFHDIKWVCLWLGVGVLALLALVRGAASSGSGFRAWLPGWVGLAISASWSMYHGAAPWLSVSASLQAAALLFAGSLTYEITRRPVGRLWVIRAIVLSGGSVAVLGIAQWFGWTTDFLPSFSHYDQPMYGVFGNQGLLGGYVALALLLLPDGAYTSRPGLWRRIPWALLGGLLFAALLLSASRAGQVALLVGCLTRLYFYLREYGRSGLPRWMGGLGIGIGVVALLYFLGGDSGVKWSGTLSATDTGMAVRCWIWRGAASMALSEPLGGVGLGNFAYHAPAFMGRASAGFGNNAVTYHAHNDLLEFVCETGILGGCFLVWQLSRFQLRSRAALSGLVALVVLSSLQPIWSSPPHGLVAVVLLGMNMGCPRCPYVARRRLIPVSLRAGLILLLIVVCSALHGITTLWPSFLLRRAEDLHLRGGDGQSAYVAATEGPGFRSEAHESFGIYLLERGAFEAALREFTMASKELDTGRLYVLMYRAATALGDEALASRCREQALQRWPWADDLFDVEHLPDKGNGEIGDPGGI